MEDKPKKRGRQPKNAVDPKPSQEDLVLEDADPSPVEPLKPKGGKRKAAAPVVVSTEKPARNKPTKKSGKTTSEPHENGEGENGSHEAKEESDVVTEKKAPARKGRTKKEAPVEPPVEMVEETKPKNKRTAGKATSGKTAEKKTKSSSTAATEGDTPAEQAEMPAVTKRGRAKATPQTTEPDVVKPKGRGRAKAKPDNDENIEITTEKKNGTTDDQESMEVEKPVPSAKPNARGRKKATTVEVPAVAPESPPKEAATQPKRGKSRKAMVAIEDDGENEEPATKPKVDSPIKSTNGVTRRKRGKAPVDEADGETVAPPKQKKTKESAPKMNKCATDYSSINFALEEDKPWNFKISSWNVAGLRSWVGKSGLDFINHEQPDILCLQETKCTEDQLPEDARHIKGYHPYWLCKPGGYAGVAIYSKKMPFHVTYGLGDAEQDQDGRLLTAEYEKFYLVCVYVPNAGNKLVTLPKRMRWDEKFHQYLRELDAKKPVILCGDMNVAHEEIDLANPKTNRKNAGFTQEERDGMTNLLSLGFVDTFRRLYPDRKSAYTFWTYMGGARAKNVGWRLDYFILSERLAEKVTDNVIRSQVYGSDHCPVTLFLNI